MDVPQRLTLTGTAYCMDGGTTRIAATDERGKERSVMLVQRMFAAGSSFGIPGRLYLDDEPVVVRSEVEQQLIALLRAADVRYTPPENEPDPRSKVSPNAIILSDDIKRVLSRGPEENIRALRDQVVEWVESPQYASFAAEAESASRPT